MRPLDALRSALATRAERPRLATQPVTLDAPPEVQDVVRAHNQVLAALESERRAKETLASFLVHEIKGPLAAIRMALEPHADVPQAVGALAAATVTHTPQLRLYRAALAHLLRLPPAAIRPLLLFTALPHLQTDL